MISAEEVFEANRAALKRGDLLVWTVYESSIATSEAARFFARAEPGDMAVSGTLEQIRKAFEAAGMDRFARRVADHPKIIESWFCYRAALTVMRTRHALKKPPDDFE